MSVDQYNRPVPADLLTPPSILFLDEKEIDIINSLDWYECEGVILIPDNEIGGEDPQDSGIEVDQDGNVVGEILLIDQCLHRFNQVDGWYHA